MNSGLEEYKDTEYDRLTAALKTALLQIRSDPHLAATVAQVSRMAHCSRQVLYSPGRRWVVTRVRRIGRSRALRDKKLSQSDNGASVKDDDSFEKTLQNMRQENAKLFHEKLFLKKELEAIRDENKQLGRDLKSSEQQLYGLRQELRQMVSNNVVRRKR
ncbi:hypothetical protein AB3X82_29765 [Paraburkholderia phenoliruptrix]|uniref:KfrA N-terminal DNA-binding domain-containing protein n=1 Tax=Paraburkholderia phenoliruptrix TaxID=252970 RepID=A0ABV3WLP5_9BURK